MRPNAPLVTLSASLLLAAGPASRPAAKPPAKAATKPAPAPAGAPLSVGGGKWTFNAPADNWTVSPTDHPNDDLLALVHGHGDGEIQVLVEPKDMQLRPDTNARMALQIVRTLAQQHKAAGQEMVQAPTVVKDKRFDMAIHERFKVNGAVMDQMHLWRAVGPRTVEVTIGSLSADPAVVQQCLDDGEALAAAVKYDRKAPR